MKIRNSSRACIAALGALLTIGSAVAQTTDPAQSHQVAYRVDSGVVRNVGLVGPEHDASSAAAVFAQEIHVPDAPWLRLQFDEVQLAGSKATNDASYLVITSMFDGSSQRLYAEDVQNWSYTSAYFNGDTLVVELYAHSNAGPNRLVMSELTAGDPQPETICGTTDDRILSQDARQGRLWPIGCTVWMIENGNFGNRFLTAGHCIQNSTTGAVVEFNVPLSTSGGSAQHPPANDQWPVPAGQINSNGGNGPGDDWAQFFTSTNGTGLTPREANGGGAYRLAATAPAVSGQTIRVTGYGTTSTQPNTPLSWSLVQKTHTGGYALNSGNLIRYTVDTTGGNSGSPVTDITGGGLGIAIHTHAGCTSTGGSNQGTDVSHSGLQGALANPAGTGIAMNVGCVTTIFASNNGGASGGAVFFDIVTGSEAINLTGLQMNVTGPSFGSPFTVDVYTTSGTYSGKETQIGLWSQEATGSGNNGVEDSASKVTLNNTVSIPANSTTGIALVLDANTNHEYTNGNGPNQSYSDGTITVNLGSGQNTAFSSSPFANRVWNGTICYEVDNSTTGVGPYAFSIQSNGDDQLYRIDLVTGEAVSMGAAMGLGDAEGMTMMPDGSLLAIGGSVEELWNVTSPPGSLIGSTGVRDGSDAGLDYSEVGKALYNLNGASGGSTLYRVNPNNGATAVVGTSSEFADNIAIDKNGEAYAVDGIFTDSLYFVNLLTGDMKLIGSLDIGNVSFQAGTAFLGDTLYMITSGGEIYTIDTSTGAATLQASVDAGGGWEGLAIPCSVARFMPTDDFGRTFTGNTRGHWFKAPADFLITGLRVPDESGQGVQSVEVVRFNSAVPAFPTTTNDFTSLFRAVGVENNSVIHTSIPVGEGDIIGIYGVAGAATGANSYAATSGGIPIEIFGQASTAFRSGMQFNMINEPMHDIWEEPAGPIARVEMYYTDTADVMLDADSVATGSTLDTTPLVTTLGTVSATGTVEIRTTPDPEMFLAGSGGNGFDTLGTGSSEATMNFDFDVDSLTFVYGGNLGEITVTAFDAGNNVVDEFFQADTNADQPAGPQTLAGGGIRKLVWKDPTGSFAPLDNIKILGQPGGPSCPNCACNFDTSTGKDVCDIFDFLAFQNGFVQQDPCSCDLDTSTGKGVCDIFDFLAFQGNFVTPGACR